MNSGFPALLDQRLDVESLKTLKVGDEIERDFNGEKYRCLILIKKEDESVFLSDNTWLLPL